MLKLKFELDPKNANQMLALSRFASTLAGSAEIILKEAPAAVTTAEEEAYLKDAYAKVDAVDAANAPAPEEEKPAAVTEGEKPKRKRRTKAELEAAVNAAESEEAESEEAEEAETAEEAPAASGVTLDDVRRLIAEKKGKHFEIIKFKLREEFKVNLITELDGPQLSEYYNFLTTLG